MKNIKVISANQDNEEPQLRKSLFGKAAEEFSARLQNIQESRPLVKWLHSYRLAIWLPEIKHNKVYGRDPYRHYLANHIQHIVYIQINED